MEDISFGAMKQIYRKNQIKSIDRLAAQHLKISSYELMQKAGQSIFEYVKNHKNILVVTGTGNNAGDGFIVAELAMQQGIQITLWSLIKLDKLPTDAQTAAKQYIQNGGKVIYKASEGDFDCIVDGVFGTGLNRDISGVFQDAIEWINSHNILTIAIDIPSGLDADTGEIKGVCVNANMTITIICYKPGLVTNFGKDQCGVLFLENLGVAADAYKSIQSNIWLLNKSVLKDECLTHHHNSHKGSFGKALIIGGHDGMFGALILAGNAALRSGCGMVEVVSNSHDANQISMTHPELICANSIATSRFLSDANVIAIGPGLGLNQESKSVLNRCIAENKNMVIDADA
jgi:NAD(P)H-hydrate epimerase